MRVPGSYYYSQFLSAPDRAETLRWLDTLRPIWENRYSNVRPLPPGRMQRRLLRPVYWLGNWQFACLGYYHPPKGLKNRCVRAEPYPPVLRRLVNEMEKRTFKLFDRRDIPPGWRLNTCLINYYGVEKQGEKWIDCARVGEHKDFEPGPVASLSLGERALFQFVESRGRGAPSRVIAQEWLDDSSLQIFGGRVCKDRLFHRVQRVDKRGGFDFPIHVENFKVRRINFTFRYVPEEHIYRLQDLPAEKMEDVREYVAQLGETWPEKP